MQRELGQETALAESQLKENKSVNSSCYLSKINNQVIISENITEVSV